MKYLLSFVLLFSLAANAQSKKERNRIAISRNSIDPKSRSLFKIASGASTISLGGLALAGGIIMLGEATTNSKKDAAYVVTGVGGVLVLVGGIIIGTSANQIGKMINSTARLKFTGSSISYNF